MIADMKHFEPDNVVRIPVSRRERRRMRRLFDRLYRSFADRHWPPRGIEPSRGNGADQSDGDQYVLHAHGPMIAGHG